MTTHKKKAVHPRAKHASSSEAEEPEVKSGDAEEPEDPETPEPETEEEIETPPEEDPETEAEPPEPASASAPSATPAAPMVMPAVQQAPKLATLFKSDGVTIVSNTLNPVTIRTMVHQGTAISMDPAFLTGKLVNAAADAKVAASSSQSPVSLGLDMIRQCPTYYPEKF